MPGEDIKRGLQFRSGAETCDVSAPVFWPEAKRHRVVNIRAAVRQAVRSCPPDRIPIAVTKDDRAEDLVTFRVSDFVSFVREAVQGADPFTPAMPGNETTPVATATFYPVAKHQRRSNIREVMREAIRGCGGADIPLAIVIDEGAEGLVTLRLNDFLRVVSQWWARPNRNEIAALASTQGAVP